MFVPSAILFLVFSYAVEAGSPSEITPFYRSPLLELSPSSICPLNDAFNSTLMQHVHSDSCNHHHDHSLKRISSAVPLDPITDPWTIAPTCTPTTNGSEEPFCAFTSESFYGGRGITILTKPSIARKIAQLPAFTNPSSRISSLSENDPRDPPFIIASIPGKGLGMIANRTIERGELIKAHPGVAIFHNECADEAYSDYLPHKQRVMKLTVDQLPLPTRDLFLSMAVYNESGEPYIEKIYTNTFSEDFWGEEHSLVVPETARLNHDCRPNAMYYFDLTTLMHYTHASRKIYAGEEITITYIDPLQTRLRRRQAIRRNWGFDCSCSLCSAESQFIRESNRRITKIIELNSILNQVVSPIKEEREGARSHVSAATEMVELLVSLYEQERLHSTIADGYRLAALVYSSVGNEWRALKWAMQAMNAGLIHGGPNDESVLDVRKMLIDLREHWSWAVNV